MKRLMLLLLLLLATTSLSAVSRDSLKSGLYLVTAPNVPIYQDLDGRVKQGVLSFNEQVTIDSIMRHNGVTWALVHTEKGRGYLKSFASLKFLQPLPEAQSKKKYDLKIPIVSDLLTKLLDFTNLWSWLIILILAIILVAALLNFTRLDTKINELRGAVDIRPGSPWYVLMAALLPFATVILSLFSAAKVQSFYQEKFSLLPGFDNAVHWILYAVLILNIVTLGWAMLDSIRRVGPLWGLVRFGLISLMAIMAILVGFFISYAVLLLFGLMLLFFFFGSLGDSGGGGSGSGGSKSGGSGGSSGGRSCPYCNGRGIAAGCMGDSRCNHCNGSGRLGS
jgi:hypothetical protein